MALVVGKKYKIIYDDGESTQTKNLIFKGRDNSLLIFSNPQRKNGNGKDLEEMISENKIIRIEEDNCVHN